MQLLSRFRNPLVVLTLGTCVFLCQRPTTAQPPFATIPAKHHAFFQNYCLDCHDTVSAEGQVNLEDLSFGLETVETAEMWQKILGVINAGEMPPEDSAQPVADEKASFLKDLSEQLVTARRILSDAGGVITMRRLNRREYANTIRDLLGVEANVGDLPDDVNAGGFDTAGDSLFLSSDQLEKYVQIGREALEDVRKHGASPKKIRIKRECEKDATRTVQTRRKKLASQYELAQRWRASDQPPTAFGFIDESRVEFEEGQYKRQVPGFDAYLAWPETKTGIVFTVGQAGSLIDVTKVPSKTPPGHYLVRVRAGVLPAAAEHRRYLEFGIVESDARSGEIQVLGCRKLNGTYDDPTIVEFPLVLSGADGRQIAVRERQHNTRDATRYAFTEARRKKKPVPDPAVWVDWVELTGPFENEITANAYRETFGTISALEKQSKAEKGIENESRRARTILTRFATRAFRQKTPPPAFVDKLVQLYESERSAGTAAEEALLTPLSVVLASPSFLYLREPNSSNQPRSLTDLELAVRLSYFLWSGPPDEELYELASAGKLHDPSVLAKQTDRMIADPKAMEFIRGFSHQWLQMERLDFFQFNFRRYPEFDASAKNAARQEVYETIAFLIRKKLGISHLLESEFVVINDLLAGYYGFPAIEGSEFRPVEVPADSPRGGLLGTAAVLAMGSDGERSSPVERGAWILRKLLHAPPPPAPANVPQLSRLEGKLLSARELQAAHVEEPQCAQCHKRIDPLGYGLENFDAAGRWREEEATEMLVRKKVTRKKSHPINASGTLPDGTPFESYQSMRSLIAKQEAAFARGLSEALIAYGLGRPYGFSDYQLCEEILQQADANDNQLSAFLQALVQSTAFQSK